MPPSRTQPLDIPVVGNPFAILNDVRRSATIYELHHVLRELASEKAPPMRLFQLEIGGSFSIKGVLRDDTRDACSQHLVQLAVTLHNTLLTR